MSSQHGILLPGAGDGRFTLTRHAPADDERFWIVRWDIRNQACGVRAYSRGTDKERNATMAVNLRCIPEINAASLPVEAFDGASL